MAEDLWNDGSAAMCLDSGCAIHYMNTNSSTLGWSVLEIHLQNFVDVIFWQCLNWSIFAVKPASKCYFNKEFLSCFGVSCISPYFICVKSRS